MEDDDETETYRLVTSIRGSSLCGLAPVFTVNDEVYGKATVKKLDEVLDELLK